MRTILLVVHIAAVAAWLGANFTQLALSPRFAKEDSATGAAWTRHTMWLGERYYSGAGAVIALSGVALVSHGHWSWSGGFIWVGVAVIIIGAAMGVLLFTPLAKQRVAALESGDKAAAAAALSRTVVLALVDTALVLTAIVVMVRKWHA